MSAETDRLSDPAWKRWGPYLSERAWGTVREDYSADGNAWEYFPHDHARSKAYRWGEDGLAGLSDDKQYLCFALALWNGRDPILKERLFGLTGPQGNHGEDVKEVYFYADATPTHSYAKMVYKYPQAAYPYGALIEENGQRGRHELEYELFDTGVFAENRYFDVTVEYAKAAPDDIYIRITAANRGDQTADLTLLPTLWFRNTWSWGYPTGPMGDVPRKPSMRWREESIEADHPALGAFRLSGEGSDAVWFTENETNAGRLYGAPNPSPYVKDAFHRALIQGESAAVNPAKTGTKAAYVYTWRLKAGEQREMVLRLYNPQSSYAISLRGHYDAAPGGHAGRSTEGLFSKRIAEADSFYSDIHHTEMSEDERRVQRQALAGMLWSKQLFYYDIPQWLNGDPFGTPPEQRKSGRNSTWEHLNNFDIISMPDKWEYPWYAGWDLAFHCVPLAMIDPAFAKQQLLLLTREWYMHPNGQLPAYEWSFDDVNPPVHAWAAYKVYELEGRKDPDFLKRVFSKLLINFTWWVNRKDAEGRNIFQGGFLGLDNISIFDRSTPLPTGGTINQSDGTAWMGFYCLVMLKIAVELAQQERAYEDLAIKFYQHFLWIAVAISGSTRGGVGLWDEADGFYYDVLKLPDGHAFPLKVRSLVGLMPLIAVETIGQATLDSLPGLDRSIKWLTRHRPDLAANLARSDTEGIGRAHLFAIPDENRLRRVLGYMLDEDEFLSPFGLRSLSKFHEQQPYALQVGGATFGIEYQPAESLSGLFGGNSNWRGPVWFPINVLIIEALRRYHQYYGDGFRVEYPTRSGNLHTLEAIADDLSRRLCKLFLKDGAGNRPVNGGQHIYRDDPHWRDYVLFFEYFHGDNGAGLGASHQTGWTGIVAALL
ncbi:MAG: glucosidase [Chloroflexi bacterium]|nr:glucosidase [Chloroflexota bacterium]